MVLQQTCPNEHLLFLTSSLENQREAAREIARWVRTHGCRPAQPDRIYAIYHNGVVTRRWCLVERGLRN